MIFPRASTHPFQVRFASTHHPFNTYNSLRKCAGKVKMKRNYKTMDFSVCGADFGVSAS
jgi:hypothetical protein